MKKRKELAALYDTKQTEITVIDGTDTVVLPVKGHICVPAVNPSTGKSQTLYAPLVMENQPVDSQTISLLHFDDVNNPYKDECGNTWSEHYNTWNRNWIGSQYNGTADTDAAITTIYNSSALALIVPKGNFFDKIGRTLCIPLGGRDYTVDFRAAYFPGVVCITDTDLNNLWAFNLGNNSFRYHDEGTNLKSSQCFSNAWYRFHHFAVVYNYSANTLTVYQNGIQKSVFQLTTPHERALRRIYFLGCYSSGRNSDVGGYIDEFRIVDGLQVWTENFTPPTKPYDLVTEPQPCPIEKTVNGKFPPCIGIKRSGKNLYTVR